MVSSTSLITMPGGRKNAARSNQNHFRRRNCRSSHSPKTGRHEGHERREIPIFSELMGPLQEVWKSTEPGTKYVLPFMRGKSDSVFRKPLIAAIKVAGASVWPKLFTALRATRDTEIRDTYPSHVVDCWLGHNEIIAKRNYLQVTDAHYAKAVHNPVQSPAAPGRSESQAEQATFETLYLVTRQNGHWGVRARSSFAP